MNTFNLPHGVMRAAILSLLIVTLCAAFAPGVALANDDTPTVAFLRFAVIPP